MQIAYLCILAAWAQFNKDNEKNDQNAQYMVLCRIVPSGSVPHRYRTNLNFVSGSLRYDVVYNLDEDSKNIF